MASCQTGVSNFGFENLCLVIYHWYNLKVLFLRKGTSLILNLFASLFVKSQDTLALKNLKNITCLSIDAKGNKYLSDDSYTLYKYNVNNKLITNVNNKSYGNITSIDCSNPFEIYVFYKDQNIIVFFVARFLNHPLPVTVQMNILYRVQETSLDINRAQL